jgi:LmbE family N-acetylglucosaminyl deacetylase
VHLFLSPHYDDAVLSCGGLIRQLARNGETVRILTVMGDDIPAVLPDTPIIRDLHQRWQAGYDPVAVRRQEDQCAAEAVNAQADHLPYPDCVYRVDSDKRPLYPSEESLFGDVHPDDPLCQVSLAGSLPHDLTALYVPLGVGHHVDHQIVRDWGLSLRGELFVLKLYAEYPYSRDKTAVAHVLQHGHPLKSERVTLSEQDVQAKLRGIACYRSQISTFWGSISEMEQAVRQFMMEIGGSVYAETYYSLQDTPA